MIVFTVVANTIVTQNVQRTGMLVIKPVLAVMIVLVAVNFVIIVLVLVAYVSILHMLWLRTIQEFPSYENEFNANLCLADKSFQFGECLINSDFDLYDQQCISDFKKDFENCPCQVSKSNSFVWAFQAWRRLIVW